MYFEIWCVKWREFWEWYVKWRVEGLNLWSFDKLGGASDNDQLSNGALLKVDSSSLSKNMSLPAKFFKHLIVIFWRPTLLKNVMNLPLTVNKCWLLYKQHLAILLIEQQIYLLFVYVMRRSPSCDLVIYLLHLTKSWLIGMEWIGLDLLELRKTYKQL